MGLFIFVFHDNNDIDCFFLDPFFNMSSNSLSVMQKNKLGVSPEVLYRDFQSLKNSQQYDLTGKVDYDKWIENESSKLL